MKIYTAADLLSNHPDLSGIITRLYKDIQKDISHVYFSTELEFYIRPILRPADMPNNDDIAIVKKEILSNFGFVEDFKNENGQYQFEITTNPIDSPLEFINRVKSVRKAIKSICLKNHLKAIFHSKPFAGQEGSSMQVNLSLHDIDKHLISDDSYLFKRVCSGILLTLNSCIFAFVPSSFDYNRFKNLDDIKKFLNTPSYLSISNGDNRTAAVRICNSNHFTDRKGQNVLRIEHRTPSSDAPVALTVFLMLAQIKFGLITGINAFLKIEGNVFDPEIIEKNKLVRLPLTVKEARDYFDYSEGFRHFVQDLLDQEYKLNKVS